MPFLKAVDEDRTMEFGKVSPAQLAGINWVLPPLDSRPFAKSSDQTDFRLGFGAPVWNVKGWVGQLYPPDVKPQNYLRFYAAQFNSIELNTTHYRTPDLTTVKRWRSQVGANFKFNPKVLQEISHHSALKAESSLRQNFFESILAFEEHLGICFLQLPPQFSPQQWKDLETFLGTVPGDLPFAIEFRHPLWFNEGALIPLAYDLLVKHQVSTVITDVAGQRGVLHSTLTTDQVCIRFIGNNAHVSDFTRVAQWAERLREWRQQGVTQIEFFLHEPEDLATPEVAPFCAQLFSQKSGFDLPQIELKKGPEQIRLF